VHVSTVAHHRTFHDMTRRLPGIASRSALINAIHDSLSP
jgi:hypothetical protein